MGRSGNPSRKCPVCTKDHATSNGSVISVWADRAGGAEGGRRVTRASPLPKSHPASKPGFSPGRISRVGRSSTLDDSLGGQVSASNGSLHRGRPAGIGPVTRQEEAVDRRALRQAGASQLRAGRRTSPRAR